MQYLIKGGTPLVGEVDISGAKNAALPILAASILSDEPVTIENLPDVSDISAMLEAIQNIGAYVKRIDRHTVMINGSPVHSCTVDHDSIKKIRASYYLLGALIGKCKMAEVPLPGGCDIGTRPIDQHIKGFQAIGIRTKIERGNIVAEGEHMHGEHIFFDVVSVGATINVMIAATLAEGQTVIENAAKEPHVVDTANFLNSMGANIRGAGTDVIRIRGVKKLKGCTYSIVPDMIEAGTYMLASAVTKGDVTVRNIIPKHMEAITAKLREIGCEVQEGDDSIRVVTNRKNSKTNIKTMPYPGFPTDMQPQFSVVLCLCEGASVVTENIFENRFRYVAELTRMGADVIVEANTAIITGIEQFSGANVSSPDLRAGAALVLAGLNADGITQVDDIEYIQRGYEDFDKKLRQLGAKIEVAESKEDALKFKFNAG